jgi:hypothetical protein
VGPDRNDWAAPDAELHRFHNRQTSELGLHLLGRRLYEVMAFWETAEERNPSALDYQLEFARIWKQLPKLVFSKSLEAVEETRASPVPILCRRFKRSRKRTVGRSPWRRRPSRDSHSAPAHRRVVIQEHSRIRAFSL